MSRALALMFCIAWIPLTGCAVPHQPYRASSENKPWGYAQAPVRPDCYEVGYVGHKNFTPNDTHYYATLRAAELVLQAGKPAFEILLTRDTLGQRNIYYPPTYDTITTTDAYGNIISTTTVETSPGYTITTDYPMTTILIRLLDSPRANSLNAAALSAGAIKSGIPLDPKTLARLGPAS